MVMMEDFSNQWIEEQLRFYSDSGACQPSFFYNISLRPRTPGGGLQTGALQGNDIHPVARSKLEKNGKVPDQEMLGM